MEAIALFNQAGGVGKTTLTFNLGYHLSEMGKKVLVIDMDPQASLTLFTGLNPAELQQTVYDALLDDDEKIAVPIHSLELGFDIVPANIMLASAEQQLVADDMRGIRLVELIKRIPTPYDYVLIDCPPSLGLLSSISLNASNWILVPVQPEYKALMGTGQLLQTIKKIQKRSNKKLKIMGFVPNLCTNTTQHERGVQGLDEQLSKLATVFPPIPRRIDFSNSSEDHKPLALYSKKNKEVYEVLAAIATSITQIAEGSHA